MTNGHLPLGLYLFRYMLQALPYQLLDHKTRTATNGYLTKLLLNHVLSQEHQYVDSDQVFFGLPKEITSIRVLTNKTKAFSLAFFGHFTI